MKPFSIAILFQVFSLSVLGQSPTVSPEDSVRQLADSYRYAEAIQLADRHLVLDSTNFEMLNLKARALQAYFQNQGAIGVFERIYRLDTTRLSTLNDLVNANRLTGQYKQASIYCEKITHLFPDNLYFRTQLANLYSLDERFRMALDVLIPIIRADSSNLYVLRQIGNSFASLGMADSAIVYYQKALLRDSMDVATTVKLSNQYILKKAYDTALLVTEMFLRVDTTDADVTKQNAYCYYLLRNYAKAQGQFTRCIELGDWSKLAYKYLGLSYYKADEFVLAEPWFREAYYADTTDAEVCFYYGVSATRALNPDTGLMMLNKTLETLAPLTAFISTVYVQLAEVYNSFNDADTALWFLIKAGEQNPSDVNLLFRIGYQYDLHLKNVEMALVYYEKFLSMASATDPVTNESSLSIAVSFTDYAAARVMEIKKVNSQSSVHQ